MAVSGPFPRSTSSLAAVTNGRQELHRSPGSSNELGSGLKSGGDTQGTPGRMAATGVAQRSMSERFQVDTHTAGASFTIPIQTSPGRNGLGPTLQLQYSTGSAATNSLFGMGWTLSGVDSISRKTSNSIPSYDDDKDVFFHSGIGDLVPVLTENGQTFDEVDIDSYRVRRYQPRIQSGPVRIERWMKNWSMFWKVINADNVATVYGLEDSSQIFHRDGNHPDDPKRVFSWLVSESYDSDGNHMVYSYKADDLSGVPVSINEAHRCDAGHLTQHYIKSIRYGNQKSTRHKTDWKVMSPLPGDLHWLFEVVFDYGEHDWDRPTTQTTREWDLRPDPFSVYRSGFEIRTYRRCHRVLMFHHFPLELGRQDCLVASTCFQYQAEPKSRSTFLESCIQRGHSPIGLDEYWTASLPVFEFQYQQPPSLEDLPMEELNPRISGVGGNSAQWIDLNGEGAPGILADVSGGWYYQRNSTDEQKAQVGDPQMVDAVPSTLKPQEWDFEDISGDGLPDVVLADQAGTLRGFYRREESGSWAGFTSFETYPVLHDAGQHNTRRIDLTGDGNADLLRMANDEDQEMTWYPSLGPCGFGSARRTIGAPLLPVHDVGSAILLSDMTGDGLADIVNLTNANICYWPNMGHGRFGAKVTMENAPLLAEPSAFSPSRIRMADITGSGTTDLIYVLPEGGAVVYSNQSGNCWDEGDLLPSIPALDRNSSIDILDITGRGTHCLCWTSDFRGNAGNAGLGTVRYVDLAGKQRPGLLARCLNGIGGETILRYRSSSMFYRDDERAGRPWTTRLPFPIQCVARIETLDHVAQTSQITRYSYHNGYYDPVDRQFQGFQMVETWDAEEYLMETPATFQRPPILSRSWYNIGLDKADGMATLPWSYRVNHPQHTAISTAKVPADLTPLERHEAYRALAGRLRRHEIFSADKKDEKSPLPYTITQKNYEIVLEQKVLSGQRYAICRVNDREEVSAHYERVALEQRLDSPCMLDLNEARVQHHLTLKTDRWGNKLLEAIIQYGKLRSQMSRPEDQRRQTENVINYTETSYTNVVESKDYFHAPVVSQVQQYRVFPRALPNGHDRYCWNKLAEDDYALLTKANDIPIHQDLENTLAQNSPTGYKVLVAKEQTIYTTEDLRRPLPAFVLERFSRVYQTYQLAFTSQLLIKAYANIQPTVDTDLLQAWLRQGGYVELPSSSGQWYSPSPRAIFGDDPEGDFLAAARSQFYIPNGQIDPHGNVSRQKYDSHFLLLTSSTDAILNTTGYENDYARLQPTLVTDPNMNRRQVAVDPLGRQIGVAEMGKVEDGIGDSFARFAPHIESDGLDSFFRDPCEMADKLLGTASSRTIYDLDRYRRTVPGPCNQSDHFTPSLVAELVRHNHCNSSDARDKTQTSIHINYISGTGGGIQEATLTGRPEDIGGISWNVSGWVLHDNKGQPVRQFQPFTAVSHQFQRQIDRPTLPAITTLRDPLGRIVGVLQADHTWSKTRFTPWAEASFDAGDTVRIDDPANDVDIGSCFRRLSSSSYFPTWYGERAPDSPSQASEDDTKSAQQSEVYQNTPLVTYLDTAGRPICHATGHAAEERETRNKYNAWGQQVLVWDSLGRTADIKQYDLLGRPLYTCNMDQGQRGLLPDMHGAPLLSWSDRGIRQRMEFDKLRRPTNLWVQMGPAAQEALVIKNVYGDQQPRAVEHNLKGQLWRCYDQSGLHTNEHFDFKGNCTEFTIRYAIEYKQLINWLPSTESSGLEEKGYKTNVTFNALGQPLEMSADGADFVRREYDVASRLKAVRSFASDEMTVTSSASNIEYEPDNKLKGVTYGNGSRTTHTYDLRTRHLIATQTVRGSDNKTLQNQTHTYDCMGKIICTRDHAQQNIFFQNAVILPVRRFWYDFVGQLIKATGREQIDVANGASKQLRPYDFNSGKRNTTLGDGKQMIRYEERYTYDKAGNILQMQHVPGCNYTGWTRAYAYEERSCIESSERSNRLTRTEAGGVQQHYQYNNDAGRHGCMTKIPGYSSLSWNYTDNLHSSSKQQVSGDATPETTWYVYDAGGTRVRKVTERSMGAGGAKTQTKSKETRYLPMYDLFANYNNTNSGSPRQITSLSVGDATLGGSPVAILEQGHGSGLLVRYQVDCHLELDSDAVPISYQEYSPFGATTYQYQCKGVPRKYRFAGYQRDHETGLDQCGARYYAAWLGRWISADPLGSIDGPNLYRYSRNDPVNFQDPRGTAPTPTPTSTPTSSNKKATSSANEKEKSLWKKFSAPLKNDSLHGIQFDVDANAHGGKEIGLQSDDPISTGLQLLRPAINDESGTFKPGYKIFGVGDAKQELLHGFSGASNEMLTLPKRDGETMQIGGTGSPYEYEFRIDWDERKQARHVNLNIKMGKETYDYAIYHKQLPESEEAIVPLQLAEAIHGKTSRQLRIKFENPIVSDPDSAISKWYHSEFAKMEKNTEQSFHTKEVVSLTSFSRYSRLNNSKGEIEGPSSAETIGGRVWVWAQHRLAPAGIMAAIAKLNSIFDVGSYLAQ